MRILLLDVFALLHRAYHALPKLTTAEGEPIGAVYGFSTLLLKALKELKPDIVLAALDLPEPTFRHETFPAYQATRPETPEDLVPQIEKVKDLLDAFEIPTFALPGFEADDVIGTLAWRLGNEDSSREIIVLTGDLDSLQLISPQVKIYALKKGISEMAIYDRGAFEARFGFPPDLLPDYKGLVGDASDNIPGVRGIGPKTAGKLLSRFGTLENLYRALEKGAKDALLSDAIVEKLRQGKAQAFLSKKLATIRLNLSLPEEGLKEMKGVPRTVPERAKELFLRWGFKVILARLEKQGELQPENNS